MKTNTSSLQTASLTSETLNLWLDLNNGSKWLSTALTLHNGEPWNAAAAQLGIDITGGPNNSLSDFFFHGAITGKVVDNLVGIGRGRADSLQQVGLNL